MTLTVKSNAPSFEVEVSWHLLYLQFGRWDFILTRDGVREAWHRVLDRVILGKAIVKQWLSSRGAVSLTEAEKWAILVPHYIRRMSAGGASLSLSNMSVEQAEALVSRAVPGGLDRYEIAEDEYRPGAVTISLKWDGTMPPRLKALFEKWDRERMEKAKNV